MDVNNNMVLSVENGAVFAEQIHIMLKLKITNLKTAKRHSFILAGARSRSWPISARKNLTNLTIKRNKC